MKLILLSAFVWAEAVRTVTHLGGVLRATRADGASRLLSVKSEIQEGDILKTEKSTYTRIKFLDDGEVVLRHETVFRVDSYSFQTYAAPERKDNIVLGLV